MKGKIEFNKSCNSYSNEFTLSIGLIKGKEGYVPLLPASFNDDNPKAHLELPQLPIIEFGLIKKGCLNIPERFQIPKQMTQNNAEDNGATRVHPTTDSECKEAAKAAKNILQAFHLAVQAQVECKGYFHQPFFIRYAVRMADGSHPRISPPVLMLPTVLPPCLGIASTETSVDFATISLSPSTYNYFALNYRILKGLPDGWNNHISGIEFFITEPIPTFEDKSSELDGILPYSKIVGTVEDTFVGHWAEGDGNFIDHSVSDCGIHNINAWSVHTNDSLNSSLISPGKFYKIATLTIDEITASEQFKELSIQSSSKEGIKMGEILNDDYIDATSLADPIIVHNEGIANVYFSEYQLPELQHLRIAMPFAGKTNDNSQNQLKITVRGKRFGKTCCRTTEYDCDNTPSLIDNFPRNIFFADPSVFEIHIKQGLNLWILPMRPTLDGKYSFWSRGFVDASKSVTPQPTLAYDNQSDLETIPLDESRMAKSSVDSFVFKDCAPTSIGKVTAATGPIAISETGIYYNRRSNFEYIDFPFKSFTMPDLPYWQHLCPIELPDFTNFLNASKITIKNHRVHIESSIAEGIQSVYSLDNKEWSLASDELEGSILLTAPIKPDEDNGLVQIASISFCGKFLPSHVHSTLYASNDKKNWMLAAASKSPGIENICGIRCRYWRAVAICHLDADEYIDGLIFDYE